MAIASAVIASTVSVLIDVLQFMMFARAICSWIPALSQTPFSDFLYTVTEWVIMPVRAIFDRFSGGNMMIDIPFFITFLLLSILSSVL